MLKRFVAFCLVVLIITLFSSCGNNPSSGPHVVIDDPPPSYKYGFNEECSNGTKHIKIESFEVSTNYESSDESNAVHYYVVLGVDTNLSDDDFSSNDNLLELWLSPQERFVLNFVSWNVDTKKLVYEIPQNKSLDYSDLLNLEISNSEEQFPFLYLIFNVFDRYCVVENTLYSGQRILLRLER